MITLMSLAVIGIFVLAFNITVIIFLKVGRPSNWFKDKETKD